MTLADRALQALSKWRLVYPWEVSSPDSSRWQSVYMQCMTSDPDLGLHVMTFDPAAVSARVYTVKTSLHTSTVPLLL